MLMSSTCSKKLMCHGKTQFKISHFIEINCVNTYKQYAFGKKKFLIFKKRGLTYALKCLATCLIHSSVCTPYGDIDLVHY